MCMCICVYVYVGNVVRKIGEWYNHYEVRTAGKFINIDLVPMLSASKWFVKNKAISKIITKQILFNKKVLYAHLLRSPS